MAGYIGNKSSIVSSGAERKFKFTITETTTTLSNLAYTRDLVHVFHNGVRLVDGTDYTATNGTSITLTNAAENGDEVVVVSYASFQPSDTVSASTGGVFEGNITVNADLTVSGNTDINGGSVDGVTLGTNSAVTEAQVDNINIDGNTISSTNTNGDINLEPDGTGGVVTTKTITAAQYDSTESLPDIKPSLNLDFANVKKLDPRITYTRASTGTYYDGKTFVKAEENLLLQSQDFTTTWGGTRVTVTADTDTAPDGTATADSFLQASGQTISALLYQDTSVVAGDYVVSVYAKPNGKNFLAVRETALDGTANDTWFNVSTGAVGTSDAGHTATITASTNSYYRCSIKLTVNAARTGRFSLYVADSDGSLTVADDTNGLYLWGAQLEQRSALTDYTATTTQPITNYVPALQTAASGEARFDHDPVTGESLGFLIEEQRTNLVTYSEDFANAAWTVVGTATAATNQVISPDGTLTADKFVLGDAIQSGGAALYQNATKPATSAPYTVSLYAKAGEFNSLRLILRDASSASNSVQAYFNLATGTIAQAASAGGTFTAASATITAVGNGWYRISVTGTSSTETALNVRILNYQDGTGAATGDGYSGIYLWGAQLEAGAFPTSYIKTVASQATRNADAAEMTGTNFSEWYRQDEGTAVADWVITDTQSQTDSGHQLFAFTNTGFTTPIIAARMGFSTFRRIRAFAQDAGSVFEYGVDGAQNTATQGSLAVAYSNTNDFVFSDTGAAVVADTTGSIADFKQVEFHLGRGFGGRLSGHLKKFSYYPKRLSNATLQALTEE